MRKPSPALVLTVALPFLTGCMGVMPHPVPEPAARSELAVRGVILGDGDDGERVRFDEVSRVEWTDSTIAIVGVREGSQFREFETSRHRLSDVGALLVRQVDVNRTSLLIAGILVGGSAIIALLVTGKTTDDTILR